MPSSSMYICQILMSMLHLVLMTNGRVFHFEAVFNGLHDLWGLTNATKGTAAMIMNGEHISLHFCLRTASTVQVSDIRYFNGNEIDIVNVQIDNDTVAILETNTSGWQTFMSTGPLSGRTYLDIGLHTLHVRVNDMSDGMVLDYVEIDVNDNFMTQEIAMCELTCVLDVPFNVQSTVGSDDLSYAFQKSYNTTCAEVTNVNVPIFDHLVKRYEITAAMPQYRSLSNWRSENTNDCYHLSQFIWIFKDIKLSNAMPGSIRSDKATVYFTEGLDTSSKLHTVLTQQFNLEGKSKGMIDTDRGSTLRIQFSGMTEETIVQMQYKGKGDISPKEQQILTPSQSEASWLIPDFTWTETDLNFIYLYINSNTSLSLSIDSLSLERRKLLPDKIVAVYKDDDVIVEAILAEFWWLTPDTMRLTLSNQDSYNNVSYFRIYRPTPWNSEYAQVFVMYQDGYTRLSPLPPHGMDWIPFGSSVIIGQSNPTVVRPYAAINNVYVDLQSLIMDVKYNDGGSAKLQLKNNMAETRVIVYDIVFGQSSLYPFATFSSMYVADGNCDVDHISVNGGQPMHIMENFGSIMGHSFVFYRKCMSQHLNLSADIYINIKRSK